MNIYERQQNITVAHNAAIIGCGGTGTWAAIIAALAGVPKLVLVDFDTVEHHNLNRLPFPPEAIGMPKVQALKDFIKRVRPEAHVITLKAQATPETLAAIHDLHELDAIFDCTDRIAAQKAIYDFAQKRLIRYVRCGCTINSSTASNFVSDWGDAPDGYEIVPSWAVTAAIAGALGVAIAAKEKITVATTVK